MIRLFNQDCMEAMKDMKDKQYSLAICDPPYGIDFAMEKERKPTATRSAQFKFVCKEWDRAIPNVNYFSEIKRVSKNQIIWGGNYFLDYLGNTNCIIIWDKLNPEGMRFSDGEMAWCSFNTSLRIYKSLRTYMQETQMHPTQKPIKLYKWLLNNYAKPGDKILDTHGGSMSIAIACYDLGFDLDLYEIDKEYFEAGKKRLEKHMSQGQIFLPDEQKLIVQGKLL
jgi:site-specific DNA-methyltransferase (adenine-specific)